VDLLFLSRTSLFTSSFSALVYSYYLVLQVAGLLHDLGKSGDDHFEYLSKPDHPKTDHYFRGRPYYSGDSAGQDLMSYLQRNCVLTLQEWTLVQIIVGLHYDLGKLLSTSYHRRTII
jgi:hypothetical protein